MFARSRVLCKQIAGPKAKACSSEASRMVNTKELTLLIGGWDIRLHIDSHLDLKVQCENQKLYI